MKRFTALILTIVIGISTVFGMTGCTAVQEDGALTMGQWLTLVAESFGMQSYTEEKPYFEKVPSSDSSFAAFQMAAEWDIVEPSAEIDSSTPLKWNDILITLVNAGDFVDEDATDQEKIDYAINNIDTSVRDYWGDRYVKLSEAVPVLDKAQKLWANRKYEEAIEEVKFEEGVKDFTASEDLNFELEGNTLRTTDSRLADLQEGDVYALSANDKEPAVLKKVESIEQEGEEIIITNEDETDFTEDEMMEQLQDLQIQSTDALDFTKVAEIYDASGNLVYSANTDTEQSNSNEKKYEIAPLSQRVDSADSLKRDELTFDLAGKSLSLSNNGYAIDVKLQDKGVKVTLSKELSKKTNRYKSLKTKAFVSAEVSNVNVNQKIDFKWGKLKNARVSIDYKNIISGGITTTKGVQVGKKFSEQQNGITSLNTVLNQYKDAISDLSKEVRNREETSKDSIYIGKFNFWGGKLLSISLVLKGNINASGELSLSFEIDGCQGVEFDGDNVRFIKEKNTSIDCTADGSVELTISPGIGIYVFDDMGIVEFNVEGGAGLESKVETHVFDQEMHELMTDKSQIFTSDTDDMTAAKMIVSGDDILSLAESEGGTWKNYQPGSTVEIGCGICWDWKIYPILKIGIAGDCTLGKALSRLKVKYSIDILGKNNTILKGHVDIPNGRSGEGMIGINSECGFDFKPWDEVEDTEEKEEVQQQEIQIASTVQLSSARLFMNEGQEATVSVVGLPKGYELKDLTAKVDDESIATYDLDTFTVKTKDKPGTTQIVIQTKDGKHKAYCAVTINEDFSVDFEGLPEM